MSKEDMEIQDMLAQRNRNNDISKHIGVFLTDDEAEKYARFKNGYYRAQIILTGALVTLTFATLLAAVLV